MKTSKSKAVYVNPKQAAFLAAKQKRKTFHGGRASGKSSAIGYHNYQKFNALPRAKSMMPAITYNHALTKTLPAMIDAWSSLGLMEYDRSLGLGHYVVCTKPPASFLKPYQPPRKYENVITFINGYTIELLSMDRPESNRGGNYDAEDLDESNQIKKEDFDNILTPSIRGNIYRFDHYLHQSICDFTSASWLQSGQWIYETEELAKKFPNEYFFLESTAKDNELVLGPNYISRLKATMPKISFDVEVMNIRLKRLPNSFYPSFNDTRHCKFNTFSYDFDDKNSLWHSSASDCDSSRPIEISCDFNAAFTSMIVCQEWADRNEFRILNNLYVKDSDISLIDALVDLLVDKYQAHGKKTVFIYGDRNGNNKSPGAVLTFYQQMMARLAKNGWECSLMVMGLDPDHRLKQLVMTEIFAENNPRLPMIRINQNTCKDLIISIQNTPILPDFRKDKRSEATLLMQEHATHLSDCLDNIVYRKYARLFGHEDIPYQVRFLGN